MSSGIAICRLCAESKHNNKQVDLEYDMLKRDKVLEHLARLNSTIDFNDNKLPSTVCLECIRTLDNCCDFVVSVESAQKVLHDLFYNRTAKQIDLSDDIIFFERAGLDECDFLSESDVSNESQDAATPNTDDDLISLADLVTHNPDSSVGSDDPLISNHSKSRTQETPSDGISVEYFGVNNPDSSVGNNEHVEVITLKPAADSVGIIQLGNSEPNNTDHNVGPDDLVKETNAIIPTGSSASNNSDNNQQQIISLSIGLAQTISHSKYKSNEYLGLCKTKDNADTDVHIEVITSDNESQSDGNPLKASNNLDPDVELDKFKEKKTLKRKVPAAESSLLDLNSPKHIKAWKDYNWLCTYCETIFPTIDELRSHSMEIHSICNPYRCTQCKLRHQCLNPFLQHITRHIKHLKETCFKCPAKFDNMHKAKKHFKVHSNKISCPGCCTTFKNSKALKAHQELYLELKYMKKIKNPLIGDDGLTCTVCSRTFKNHTSLRKHLPMHTGRKRDHVCEICGKEYFEKNHLTYHMGTHSDDRPFKCKICNLGFQRQNVLKEHVWTHNDKLFPCDKCDKSFKLQKQLKWHSALHVDKLPFECDECKKCFRAKGTLKRHLRVHSGEKPFVCKLCRQTFRNKSNLNHHSLKTHNLNIARQKKTKIVVTKDTLEWKKEIMRRKHTKRN